MRPSTGVGAAIPLVCCSKGQGSSFEKKAREGQEDLMLEAGRLDVKIQCVGL
jgi:hypothetical protein